MTQIDLLKQLFDKTFERENVKSTPSILQQNPSRWGYIDNDYTDPEERLGVLFAAVELEITDIQFHPEIAHAEMLANRATTIINRNAADWNNSDRYIERIGLCRMMHEAIIGEGWIISDMFAERHGHGSNWIVRYSRQALDNPKYCWQLRVLYVPSDYDEDIEAVGQYYDQSNDDIGEREYIIANYESGELTNVDTHDVHTGQLLRRLYVERSDRTYDNSPGVKPEEDNNINHLGRLAIHTHRIEFISQGERHSYAVSIENEEGTIVSRDVVVERYDVQNNTGL